MQRLDYFDDSAIADIVRRVANLTKTEIDVVAAEEIAKRSRGTARVAQRLFRRVRDYSQVEYSKKTVESDHAIEALDKLGVDSMGLDELDRKILSMIIKKFAGGPVGLSTIAAAVSEELDTISDVYEPFLMQRGLLKRTPRGRVATAAAYEHLGLDIPSENEAKSNGQKKLV